MRDAEWPRIDLARLGERQLLITSKYRRIYGFSEAPGLLFKEPRGQHPRRYKRVLQRLVPAARNRALKAELRHQSELIRRGVHEREFPIPPVRGLAVTERGTGVVVDKITAGGEIAPTLRALKEAGALPSDLAELLNEFADRAFRVRLRLSDPHAGNVVLGDTGGRRRIWLVDGIGERSFGSRRNWDPRAVEAQLERGFGRIADELEMSWDPAARRFAQ